MMKHNNNWVEIAGLPGVGKTTLVERHKGIIKHHYELVESRKPAFLQKVLAKILLHGWLRWRLDDYSIAQSLAYRLSFRTIGRKRNVLFYDSGIVQLFFEKIIEEKIVEIEDWIKALERFSLPSTLIYVTDLPENIIERELNRAVRRFNFDRTDLAQRYNQAEELIKRSVFPLINQVHIVNIQDEKRLLEILGA